MRRPCKQIKKPFSAAVSEAFASDFVLIILSGTPGAFDFLPSCLLFRPLSSRVALAGLRRVFSRVRVSESHANDERGDPELEGYLLGSGDTELLFSSVLEIRFVVAAPRIPPCDRLGLSFISPGFDLSALLMLRLSTDCLALRAAIGLFEPLGLALLGVCHPLHLSRRRTATRAFSGYRAVLGTRSLHIPVIALVFDNSARLLFSPVEWNEGCWGV